MPSLSTLVAVAAIPAVVNAYPLNFPGAGRISNLAKRAQLALNFVAPSTSPLVQSPNYAGAANGTLSKKDVVPGKAFDRLIHIWLENTDAEIAMATPSFSSLAQHGVTHSQRYALTHPSEPEYLATVAGDFFGMADDAFYHLPENITTLFDLFEDGGSAGKPISYACYQENMPSNGYTGFNYTEHNYLTGNGTYTFYVRKHNPCAMADFVSGNATRAIEANRNFNQFSTDLEADALPQWMFITPNLVNDGHDTTPAFFSNWTEYFLLPLLNDTRFNNNRTAIILTFDENESYGDPNRIATILLGGVVPQSAINTTDSTYYTHYSDISSVEANWGLKNLGRGDMNKTLANVYSTFAHQLNHTNTEVSGDAIPINNATGVYPGAFSNTQNTDFTFPPNADNNTLIKAGLNKSMTEQVAFAYQVNLTSQHLPNPYGSNPFPLDYVSRSGSSNGAAGTSGAGKAVAAIALLAGAASLL
ncbi:hypothetical protein K437DRAFT_292666 [Tilletiaria anomala UBC 951]|uniref:Phosphoesterase-domain-containing protein n=1 Tax=Tilletiaria anomala (strain ATCC 24038 / CBS 436.72 / UBC 951) TaxID=1037660 RepID=A0A066WK98_TILAU|nr:uncharacterized protein K437DRAFT_292666 [Tilletiaria anomala UBC 951]KDN52993.1 hypothetical protein K437DRAFT_292666 [Tilletiaria anomala UBC 951]